MQEPSRGARACRGLALALLIAGFASCSGSDPGAATTDTTVGAAEGPGQRPNFLVILVDDLRWDDIGAAGHPFVETPNIDRIAREGARFTNAFATTPLCSPSRA